MSYPITYTVTGEGIDETASSFDNLGSSMQAASDDSQQLGGQVQQTSEGMSFGVSQGALLAGSLGGMAISGISLYDSFGRVNDANLKLENSQNNLTKAQDAYNAVVAKYGADSPQAQKALLSLENAQNNLAVAQQRADMAQNSQISSMISFATSTIPSVILAVQKVGPALLGIGSSAEEMAATSQTGFTEMDVAAEETGVTMDALPIIGIIAAIITVVTLLYEAWTNDWGGIREKTMAVWNDVKPIFDAIGNGILWIWNNVLVPFGEAWISIFGGIGSGVEAVYNDVLKPIFDAWVTAITDILNGIKAITDAVSNVGNTISGGLNSVTGGIGGSVSSFLSGIGLQGGGIVTSPTLAVVGEAGPEVVIPLADIPGYTGTGSLSQLPSLPGPSGSSSSGASQTVVYMTINSPGLIFATQQQFLDWVSQQLAAEIQRQTKTGY
jgi:hypothetical protein